MSAARRHGVMAAVAAALFISGVCLVAAPVATGQVMISMNRGGPLADGLGPPVNERELKRYCEILGLTEDQLQTVRELFDMMSAEFKAAAEERQNRMEDVRAEFEESQDMKVFGESMPAIMERFEARRDEIEKAFFGDLRLLLTPEQDARWEKMERTRRRERTIGYGTLSGESVDLVAIMERMPSLQGESGAAISALLEQYEQDLDRVLAERNKLMEEEMAEFAGSPPGPGRLPDPAKLQESAAKVREASEKVRDVNRRYARQIVSLLPGGETGAAAAEFNRAVREASFPTVYRPSYTSRVLESLAGMEGLSAEQREAIASIEEAYRRELEAANERLAQAVEESETDGSRQRISLGGGRVISLGEEEAGPVSEARSAKRELDNSTLDKVLALLSEEQKAKLPPRRERPDRPEGMEFGASAVFVTVEEDVITAPVNVGAGEGGGGGERRD